MCTDIRLTLSFDELKTGYCFYSHCRAAAIVAYINEKTAKLEGLFSELQAEIDYMKEYKQRLMADCVTEQMNGQNL